MTPGQILKNCLIEAGDDTESGLIAAEYILTHGLDTVIEPSSEQSKIVLSMEYTEDNYPRDKSNRFLKKHSIVDAASCQVTLDKLRESLNEDQRWKLDKIISHLQSGGSVHHPKEHPGLAINLDGEVVDSQWAEYQQALTIYEEWQKRNEERESRRDAAKALTRLTRSVKFPIKLSKALTTIHERAVGNE